MKAYTGPGLPCRSRLVAFMVKLNANNGATCWNRERILSASTMMLHALFRYHVYFNLFGSDWIDPITEEPKNDERVSNHSMRAFSPLCACEFFLESLMNLMDHAKSLIQGYICQLYGRDRMLQDLNSSLQQPAGT